MAATVQDERATALTAPGAPNVTDEQISELVQAIHQTPIIDNHAHPLLKPETVGQHPLLSIASEAHADAIRASVTSLPHHRAVHQLSAVLGCAPTWESVVASIEQRRTNDYSAWVARCLSGLETILVDDGLDNEDDAFDFSWHDAFTRSKCRRIVRIKALAAEIINRHCAAFSDFQPLDQVFDNMLEEFDTQIKQALCDQNVVSFKSVICYRTGLAVPRAVNIAAARQSFSDIITDYSASRQRFRRLQHVSLNDLFVHRAAIHIRDSEIRFKKPIQFHTGLGDNDITLTKSSPAHLQEFIRVYPTVPIVLLHSGYPHMRDAGYLATVYTNVFVDIGEVFPIVGCHGQESIIREIFELCPWSKVMWSTDGHWFPETYLLAIMQVREVLQTVICDFVRRGHVSWRSAIHLVQDILFRNANRVYHLGLELPDTIVRKREEHVMSVGRDFVPQRSDLEIWQAFLQKNATPDFVRVSWIDYTAKPRMRMIPFRRFDRLIRTGQPLDIGVTKAALGMLQNDVCITGVSGTGEYRLHPALESLKVGPMPGHVNINGSFREKDGSGVPLCPRTQLERAIRLAKMQKLSFLVGFEIEFVLLRRNDYSPAEAAAAFTKSGVRPPRFETLANDGHAWSASRFYADPAIARLLRDIVNDLAEAGIDVEQVHAESAPGQFELILPAKPTMEAVDALLHARETIAHRATEAGLKFTLHPKFNSEACGTASHVHLSLVGLEGKDIDQDLYESFYAGILGHLPALLAFTYSNPASYDRMVDNAWAGGRWVAWGTQNRETPLRKIEGSHWELKCLDGLANPYMALASVLLAGLSGVLSSDELSWSDCVANPATLSTAARTSLGITRMLPASLGEALDALYKDVRLTGILGDEVTRRYGDVKRTEAAALGKMSEKSRWEWLIEQY